MTDWENVPLEDWGMAENEEWENVQTDWNTEIKDWE